MTTAKTGTVTHYIAELTQRLEDAVAQRNAAERERDDLKKRLEICEAESKRAEKRRQAQKQPRKRSHG